MGINKLNDFIRDKAPEQEVTYHLYELSGLSAAVDISGLLYRCIKTCGEPDWMSSFISFLCKLKKFSIKAVCIFDGPNPPPEKTAEREKRREEGKKQLDRLAECTRIRNLLQNKYLDDGTPVEGDLQDTCKVVLGAKRKRMDTTNYRDPGSIVDALNEKIEKLEIQTLPIEERHTLLAMEIVEILGLACFRSDGEAETLCAHLAIEGKVDAVISEDTDVLAYGTPFMLAFRKFKVTDEKMIGIHTPSLLEAVGMTQEEFRDLCILLRCDYNRWNGQVKCWPPDGKKHKVAKPIGPVNARLLIETYRRIEKAEECIIDSSPLIYRRCREIFTFGDYTPEVAEVPYNKVPDFARLEEFVEEHGFRINMTYINECWKPGKVVLGSETDESSEA